MHVRINNIQIWPFCRLNLVVETFGHSAKWTNELKFNKSLQRIRRLWDKTMAVKFMYVRINNIQICPFCRLNLVVETFGQWKFIIKCPTTASLGEGDRFIYLPPHKFPFPYSCAHLRYTSAAPPYQALLVCYIPVAVSADHKNPTTQQDFKLMY